jgi:hypothetical protein
MAAGDLAEAAGRAEVVRTSLAKADGSGHDPARLAAALAERLA